MTTQTKIKHIEIYGASREVLATLQTNCVSTTLNPIALAKAEAIGAESPEALLVLLLSAKHLDDGPEHAAGEPVYRLAPPSEEKTWSLRLYLGLEGPAEYQICSGTFRRFSITALYPNDGGLWEEEVVSDTYEDAKIQAKLIMIENQGEDENDPEAWDGIEISYCDDVGPAPDDDPKPLLIDLIK